MNFGVIKGIPAGTLASSPQVSFLIQPCSPSAQESSLRSTRLGTSLSEPCSGSSVHD